MTERNTQIKNVAVMLVDDEELVTQSLASVLELETSYQTVVFNSPVQALKYLRQQAVDTIVSDFLMPDMDGLAFLGEAKKIHPLTPRVLLTGYADKENAIKAINEIGLYHYLEKPWDNDQLLQIIRNAIASKGLQVELQKQIRALDNAIRQRNELSEEQGEFRQELSQARSLQLGMLPIALPSSDGFGYGVKYKPALEIGGDFYDVVRLDDDRHALLIADATGHGIQAALCTALVKFAFGSLTSQTNSPSQILAGMNTILHSGLPTGVFVAAMVAVVSSAEKSISFANGGLPAPLLARQGGNEVERIPAQGLLLGVAPASSYTHSDEYTRVLESGDSLLLFTDGLTEAEADDGRFFEQSGLLASVEQVSSFDPCRTVSELCTRALDFRGGNSQIDDITIMAIKRMT